MRSSFFTISDNRSSVNKKKARGKEKKPAAAAKPFSQDCGTAPRFIKEKARLPAGSVG